MQVNKIKKQIGNNIKSRLGYTNYCISHNNKYNSGRNNEFELQMLEIQQEAMNNFKKYVNNNFIKTLISQFKDETIIEMETEELIADNILSLFTYIDFENATFDFDKIIKKNRLTKDQLKMFNVSKIEL